MTRDIAIAHKDYDVRGGGERLAEELARTFDVPMYVGRRNSENEPNDMVDRLTEIDYNPLPDRVAEYAIDRGGATRSAAYQLVWQQQDALTKYDTVITSGNEPLWWVPEDDQTVIAYTHSTPRWQYDLFHDVHDGLLSVGYNYLSRVLYQHNVTRPDLFVANSDLVARRIKQYWNIPDDQIRVVYPPVKTHEYSPGDADTQDFYLHLGRLAKHKRIDDVIKAFNQLGPDYPLKIAGKGPDRERLEAMADSHIEFLGYVSEQEKHELMSAAKAHVYPALNEDFGMVPVESMAAGTPVLGVDEGFTQFQLMDGKNGYTFTRDGDRDAGLRAAVQQFEERGVAWSEQRIAEFADRFSVQQFRTGMQAAVEDAQQRSQVTPDWLDDSDPTVDARTDRPAVADGGKPE